jgi:hypothetical protein
MPPSKAKTHRPAVRPDPTDSPGEPFQAELAVHILSLSAGLVGVCLTVIGLIQLALHLQDAHSLADNILAGDAVLFLVTCMLAYAGLRTHRMRRRRALVRLADACFLLALTVMTLVCAVVAFELL